MKFSWQMIVTAVVLVATCWFWVPLFAVGFVAGLAIKIVLVGFRFGHNVINDE